MKNVLYVGPYRQSDGWGNASKEYVRALKKTGCNLSIRPVYINSQSSYQEFNEFSDIEGKGLASYDTIIQHCLPTMFRRYGEVKNVGLSFFETANISSTPWPMNINLLDEMWVSSKYEKEVLEKSGVKTNIEVVPIPVDIEKYNKKYESDLLKGMDNYFKFYFIGEYISRKDINSLVTAFHREFSRNELVSLVLKVNKIGVDADTLKSHVSANLKSLKETIKIYPHPSMYREEIIITEYLSENDLMSLHQKCDCFVMPSSGEAFCMPAFDAMAFGKMPIVGANSSMAEYVMSSFNGYKVSSYEVPAIAQDRPLPYLYTGRDTWQQIDVIDLQKTMRYAYNSLRYQYFPQDIMEATRKDYTDLYSYDSISKKMEEII